MRRDICLYYNKSVQEVFNAYVQAIRFAFGKDCTPEPFHTISFGLNFSFKYNMNGGVCTLRFIPLSSGTAVNARYTIVQAGLARYKAHCQDLTREAERLLQTFSNEIDIPVENFLNPANAVYPKNASGDVQGQAPIQQQPEVLEPQPQVEQQPVFQESVQTEQQAQVLSTQQTRKFKFCNNCGTQLNIEARFCSFCGHNQGI